MKSERKHLNASNDVVPFLKTENGLDVFLSTQECKTVQYRHGHAICCLPRTEPMRMYKDRNVVACLDDGRLLIRKMGWHSNSNKCSLHSEYHKPLIAVTVQWLAWVYITIPIYEKAEDDVKAVIAGPWVTHIDEAGARHAIDCRYSRYQGP